MDDNDVAAEFVKHLAAFSDASAQIVQYQGEKDATACMEWHAKMRKEARCLARLAGLRVDRRFEKLIADHL